jgi:hypothetical protein
VPCTVNAYATAATALCSSYLPPDGGIVHGPVDYGKEPVIYWFKVPRERQHAYMKAYRTRKADNPTLGACWQGTQRNVLGSSASRNPFRATSRN